MEVQPPGPPGSAPPILVRTIGSDRSLQPGRSYLIGRDPDCDIVIADPRVSRRHAELRVQDGHWVLTDAGSANGIYSGGQRVGTLTIYDECAVRLGHPAHGLVLTCAPDDGAAGTEDGRSAATVIPHPGATASHPPPPPPVLSPPSPEPARPSPSAPASAGPGPVPAPGPGPGAVAARTDPLEIPYAVRWLVPNGERFANFDILNDNDTQLDYYRKFGHIYAVGIPAKKWRIVVVSDPELLDEVAGNELQFGKKVEDINFFDQLSNSRGGGISVIGDGEHYEQIRRVMLPWYSPMHQRTQLARMKEQARKLVVGWSELPAGEALDARAWMERYTLEVSGRGACSYDFGLFGGGSPHPFAVAVPESTKESILRVAEPRPDFTLLSGRAKRARRRRYRENNKELFRAADALVRARLHTCPVGTQTDLLSRLVTTPDPETGDLLDAQTVRDQVLMHLSNGFNGPSITGGWLAYLLAIHPDVQEKVIAEIDSITGGDPDHDLQYDDLFKLTYTTQVIKESMRIFPPMPVTIRRSLKDGTLGRYRVRRGDIIFVGTLAAHRDPRYWGPEPDRFDPEQFAIEKVVDRPRHAFIPFSVGKRQCMAQEVTFMMLRVVLYEICKHYRLRLAPGAAVVKNAIVTTKPASVPVVPQPRHPGRPPTIPATPADPYQAPAQAASPAAAPAARSSSAPERDGPPTEIPETSPFRHILIAYGSNFGSNKELAERFAERARYQGYSCDVVTLNELADSPARTAPWLLVVMTSTYTSNPPTNAAGFKAWLERTEPGTALWRNCSYLVWGLGNTQWNAFLAFPRYVHRKLSDLGATPLADFGYGDVGSPTWETKHAEWNERVWPILLELSGARPTEAAAAREAASRAATGALTSTNSHIAMRRSLGEDAVAALSGAGPAAGARSPSMSSVMRRMAAGSRLWTRPGGTSAAGRTEPRAFLAPTMQTNAVGMATIEARVLACRELLPPGSSKQTRHLELALPPGVTYRAGDHLGLCPQNGAEQVERLARMLGAAPDGLFMVPETMNVRAAPKGVVLQVRNVLASLIDITGRPTAAIVDLLLGKVTDELQRSKLSQVKAVIQDPGGPPSALRAAIDAGGFDLLSLLEECASGRLNIYDLLQVAQPLKPRYYSISSSPRVHGDGTAHLTVGIDAVPVPGIPGREFSGMSSRYVHGLRTGDRVNVFHDGADGFHLQDDLSKPMIFISAGTGFAPMRAFLWERLAMRNSGVSLGEAALFNGIRSASVDYIYSGEISQFTSAGVLDHVHIAASREQPGRRVYVQDQIRAHGALVGRLLSDGGYVYVCGSQPMRAAVRSALVDVVAEHGALSAGQAEAYVGELETTERYRPDLWG